MNVRLISLSDVGLAGIDAELLERDGVDATSTGRDKLLQDDSSLSLKNLNHKIGHNFRYTS